MKKRDLLSVEFELEARDRRASHLARVIKVITYLALAIIVSAILFADQVARDIIVPSGFILILGANLFELYKTRKFEKYICYNLKQSIEEVLNED